VVLAGGASRRLGGIPKGLERIGGNRIIDLVASALREVAPDLLLAANAVEAPNWLPGVAVVSDNYLGTGGLAGVEAALRRGRDAIVVAWDMPFVSAELLRMLRSASIATGAEVTVPESHSPHGFEPFCAVYSARVLPQLTEFLATGGGSARDFLSGVAAVERVALTDLAPLGDVRRLFFSVNTAADLERAREMASAT
jgi:molybdopterin-guanine dinucleotide biosynthesis protein A